MASTEWNCLNPQHQMCHASGRQVGCGPEFKTVRARRAVGEPLQRQRSSQQHLHHHHHQHQQQRSPQRIFYNPQQQQQQQHPALASSSSFQSAEQRAPSPLLTSSAYRQPGSPILTAMACPTYLPGWPPNASAPSLTTGTPAAPGSVQTPVAPSFHGEQLYTGGSGFFGNRSSSSNLTAAAAANNYNSNGHPAVAANPCSAGAGASASAYANNTPGLYLGGQQAAFPPGSRSVCVGAREPLMSAAALGPGLRSDELAPRAPHEGSSLFPGPVLPTMPPKRGRLLSRSISPRRASSLVLSAGGAANHPPSGSLVGPSHPQQQLPVTVLVRRGSTVVLPNGAGYTSTAPTPGPSASPAAPTAAAGSASAPASGLEAELMAARAELANSRAYYEGRIRFLEASQRKLQEEVDSLRPVRAEFETLSEAYAKLQEQLRAGDSAGRMRRLERLEEELTRLQSPTTSPVATNRCLAATAAAPSAAGAWEGTGICVSAARGGFAEARELAEAASSTLASRSQELKKAHDEIRMLLQDTSFTEKAGAADPAPASTSGGPFASSIVAWPTPLPATTTTTTRRAESFPTTPWQAEAVQVGEPRSAPSSPPLVPEDRAAPVRGEGGEGKGAIGSDRGGERGGGSATAMEVDENGQAQPPSNASVGRFQEGGEDVNPNASARDLLAQAESNRSSQHENLARALVGLQEVSGSPLPAPGYSPQHNFPDEPASSTALPGDEQGSHDNNDNNNNSNNNSNSNDKTKESSADNSSNHVAARGSSEDHPSTGHEAKSDTSHNGSPGHGSTRSPLKLKNQQSRQFISEVQALMFEDAPEPPRPASATTTPTNIARADTVGLQAFGTSDTEGPGAWEDFGSQKVEAMQFPSEGDPMPMAANDSRGPDVTSVPNSTRMMQWGPSLSEALAAPEVPKEDEDASPKTPFESVYNQLMKARQEAASAAAPERNYHPW